MNKLGINYAEESELGAEEAAALFAECGFDSMCTGYYGTTAAMEPLAEAANRHGLMYECIHSPFKHINDMWAETAEGDERLAQLESSVDTAAAFGIPYVVVHLSAGQKAPCVNDCGHRRFDHLVNHAVSRGVTLAIENQRKIGNIAFMLELYEDVENVRFCWDMGHETCFTPGRSYMPLFGDRLVFTHIQDNTCEYNRDYHMIPFDGKIDFADRIRQLRSVDYQGTLTLEILPKHSPFYEGVTMETYYHRAFEAASRLRDMMEAQ